MQFQTVCSLCMDASDGNSYLFYKLLSVKRKQYDEHIGQEEKEGRREPCICSKYLLALSMNGIICYEFQIASIWENSEQWNFM